MNHSEQIYASNRILEALTGSCCDVFCSIEEYDEAIFEIQCMIEHFIQTGDKKEVAFWRGQLQKTKVEKRLAKKWMIENNKKEQALA